MNGVLTKEQLIAKQQLRQVIDYAEGTDCRRTIQLSYFGERFPGNCGNCDNCRYPKPMQDWTIEAIIAVIPNQCKTGQLKP